ncbi:MAG TPA: hypothetical protein PLL02_00970 [Bacteroidales bacterium]|nr:hypothetical protein [Bacteroidales bacterium]
MRYKKGVFKYATGGENYDAKLTIKEWNQIYKTVTSYQKKDAHRLLTYYSGDKRGLFRWYMENKFTLHVSYASHARRGKYWHEWVFDSIAKRDLMFLIIKEIKNIGKIDAYVKEDGIGNVFEIPEKGGYKLVLVNNPGEIPPDESKDNQKTNKEKPKPGKPQLIEKPRNQGGSSGNTENSSNLGSLSTYINNKNEEKKSNFTSYILIAGIIIIGILLFRKKGK